MLQISLRSSLLLLCSCLNLIPFPVGSFKYALFIGHRVQWPLTLKALDSALDSNDDDNTLGPTHIRLVDTSASLSQEQKEQLPSGVRILDPVIPLSFTQMQEYIRKTAMREDLDFYLWMHSDVMLRKGTTKLALKVIETMMALDPRWGILYFNYDLFCAFSVPAVSQLPWDLAIPHYRADFDYYQSMANSKYNIYGNGPHSINTRPIPSQIRSSYPSATAIQHVSHGSVLMREIKKNGNDSSSSMTPEEIWGYWITDYVGRNLYFLLKWGYAWPNEHKQSGQQQHHFDHVNQIWAWIRILLRLPNPSSNYFSDINWTLGKIYVAISLVTLPLLLLVLIGYAAGLWYYKRRCQVFSGNETEKRTEHKTV